MGGDGRGWARIDGGEMGLHGYIGWMSHMGYVLWLRFRTATEKTLQFVYSFFTENRTMKILLES